MRCRCRSVARRLVALEPVDVVRASSTSWHATQYADTHDGAPARCFWLDAPGDLRGIDHEHGQARELDERDGHAHGAEARHWHRQRGDVVDGLRSGHQPPAAMAPARRDAHASASGAPQPTAAVTNATPATTLAVAAKEARVIDRIMQGGSDQRGRMPSAAVPRG